MKFRKFLAAGAGAALAFTLAACSGGGAGSETDSTGGGDGGEMTEGGLIGVAMPTETSERWIADGDAVKSGLEAAGYEVDLQFAADDIPTQQQQIDNMITNGADALIVASIDGTTLSGQLAAAAEAGIPIISYDRLINETENVDFYVSFDNFEVGVQQASSLLVGLGVLDKDLNETGDEGPYNIELFAGSPDDNNAGFFFNGAMSVLQPYIDSGVLTVPSGQTDFDTVATLRWLQETAQKRMEDILTSTYTGTDLEGELDGVLSPYDGLSRGILNALEFTGGYPATIAEGMPIVTGQDAEIASVKLIADDVQFSTIFKDTRKLAEQSVTAAIAYLNGEEPEANNTTDYDNGVKIVPSYLLESDIVYADNIQELLIDSGYWTEDEVASGQAS
ncbi:sugar ABC transporter substrate-binding protein [Demequina sp. SYSU T00039]|uniref:Sugar ABC transporter substrate-binding protein n=1 Tax=Demequina lignilytica TaxID=3051663 RepID=A0AAW7M4E7_9MICO|nr:MULTISPECIES: multiple monosaccharide ABC transporter substrate-binding protein [unclassified Demequina]MDN4478689.1 sugar ABC transporter substrate-binding protein [Demequina sp. SYSU T00039-1]MDN4488667.1 sugar ABC transporter substrate-binding protein [Demequina sp. SYSU T00039]